jgi:manganese/zinc/iron transport system permease protein
MGVVFTSLFALGLVMIVQAADHVDLDPGCVLYGAIELTPADTVIIAGAEIPRAAAVLAVVTAINAAFLLLFFKELKISSFDPALATTTGFNASIMHYLLMTLVAVTAVASFESVGNILVVAMFVVPPAAAYMLVDRLPPMVALSVVIAAASAAGGHVAALVIPSWFGYGSTTTAGMMAAAAGALFVVAAALGPRHGVLVRFGRHRILEWRILADDVVAFLYRSRERRGDGAGDRGGLRESLLCDRLSLWLVLRWLDWRGEVVRGDAGIALTERGRVRAQNLVRSHRLWEEYLLSRAGVDAGRIHEKAEQLEHFTDHDLRRWLESETGRPDLDPHGRPIPREVRGDGTNGED